MAQIFFGAVDAKDEYKDFEVLSGVTLSAGTSYLMQFQGCAYIQLATSQPAEGSGGFLLQNNQIFQLTPNGTDKLWIKTFGAKTYFNVAT